MCRRVLSIAIFLLSSSLSLGAEPDNPGNQPTDWKKEASELRQLIRELSDQIESLERRVLGNESSFGVDGLVRYEQLEVRFVDFTSRDVAFRFIARLGNDVLRGKSIDAWKRFEWTPRSEITSDVIREAAFTLPLGELSQILSDESGFYILRVLERGDR